MASRKCHWSLILDKQRKWLVLDYFAVYSHTQRQIWMCLFLVYLRWVQWNTQNTHNHTPKRMRLFSAHLRVQRAYIYIYIYDSIINQYLSSAGWKLRNYLYTHISQLCLCSTHRSRFQLHCNFWRYLLYSLISCI